MHPYSTDQARLLIDATQQYEQWIQSQRALEAFHGWMTWKTAKGNEYLYHGNGNGSQGKSLGRRTPETEARYQAFTQGKAAAQQQLDTIEDRIKRRAPMLLSLQLGKLAFELGRVLRRFDTVNMLGHCLMVGGTHAILAYEILAGHQLDGELAATEDLDFLWKLGHGTPEWEKPELLLAENKQTTDSYKLFKHLKDTDGTFSVNTERTFQARNAKGFAIDFLATSKTELTLPTEHLKPLRIQGQSWLLLHPPIRAVVIDNKGLPCLLVCPDPRLYAIHKYWVCLRANRDQLKAPRDKRQSLAVAKLVAAHLPQYPFDEEFLETLPEELRQVFQQQLAPIIADIKPPTDDLQM